MKQKGFTIIEFMIVVAILGILAAIAIPAIQKSTSTDPLVRMTETDKLKLCYKNDYTEYHLGFCKRTVNGTSEIKDINELLEYEYSN